MENKIKKVGQEFMDRKHMWQFLEEKPNFVTDKNGENDKTMVTAVLV